MPLRSSHATQFLERFEVRLVLSAAIVVSLLPLDWVAGLDMVFFGLFALEFSLRCVSVWGGRARADAASGDSARWVPWLLLVLDLVALSSFLPLVGSGDNRWFRLVRLSRILLLFGYWAPLVHDLCNVALRGERGRQVALMGCVVTAAALGGAVVLDHGLGAASPDFDEDGNVDARDRQFFVRVWWAFRQIQDPGNMLAAPNVYLAVVVSLSLTVLGLFLFSFLIGLGGDIVRELLTIGRRRPPGFRGHTVVVNTGPATLGGQTRP